MMVEVKRGKQESAASLVYRFNKGVTRSGILKEFKKRMFRERPVSRIKRRKSALYRKRKTEEIKLKEKLGLT